VQPALDGVVFLVTGSEFSAGDAVVAVISNNSNIKVSIAPCPVSLEQRSAEEWHLVQLQIGRAEGALCQGVGVGLLSGGSYEYQVTVPEGLAAGTYRLSVAASVDGNSFSLPSSEFQIRLAAWTEAIDPMFALREEVGREEVGRFSPCGATEYCIGNDAGRISVDGIDLRSPSLQRGQWPLRARYLGR
jgi:hypothetical protein